jgi:uncharacterized membrane protein YccF (DUF307 family)
VGNIIWLLLAGIWMSLAYLVAGVLAIVGIVTIPLALPAFKLAGYAAWPFGRMVVPRPDRDVALSAIGNVVWLILCGWWLAIGHLVTALLLAITIIGIPLAVASLKMAGRALWPYGRMTARCRPTPSPFASAETDTGVAVARCARRGRRGQSSKNTSTTSRWRHDIGTRRRRSAAHPATCPARKPPCRGGGAPEHGSDLVERQGEHVVQDERQPLGWCQRPQHHQQCQANRVGEHPVVLRADPGLGAHNRIGHGGVDGALARRAARAAHVEVHADDGRREPTAQVLDPAGVGATHAEPGFLDSVVGVAGRAQHPVGDRP